MTQVITRNETILSLRSNINDRDDKQPRTSNVTIYPKEFNRHEGILRATVKSPKNQEPTSTVKSKELDSSIHDETECKDEGTCDCCHMNDVTVKDYNSGKKIKLHRLNKTKVSIKFTNEPTVVIRKVIGRPLYRTPDNADNVTWITKFDDPLPPLADCFYHFDYHVQFIYVCPEGCFHVGSRKFDSHTKARELKNRLINYPFYDISGSKKIVLPKSKWTVRLQFLKKLVEYGDCSEFFTERVRLYRPR